MLECRLALTAAAKRLGQLAFLVLFACAPAYAATGVLYTAGFNAWPRPPGPINLLTLPQGGVLLGTHFWVGDSLQGFFRLDPDPHGVHLPDINLNTRNLFTLTKIGQVAHDALTDTVYVTEPQAPKGNGLGGVGVVQFRFNAATEHFDSGCPSFVRNTLAGRRPTAVALGPDRRLYIGFSTSGDIVRVDVTTLGNSCVTLPVQTIGKSQFGGRLTALAFVGTDLYLTGRDGLGVIHNATACAGACAATQVPGSHFRTTYLGLTSNGVDTIYYLLANAVWRYTPHTGVQELFATGGTLPNGTSSFFAFAGGETNLLHLDNAGNLWVGDGGLNGFGRIWFIQAGQLPVP
jgi:hypothetical protein